jgi:hypothetical protein
VGKAPGRGPPPGEKSKDGFIAGDEKEELEINGYREKDSLKPQCRNCKN